MIPLIAILALLLVSSLGINYRLVKRYTAVVQRLVVLQVLLTKKHGTNPEQRLVFGQRYLKDLLAWCIRQPKVRNQLKTATVG